MPRKRVNVSILEPFEKPDVASVANVTDKKELDKVLIQGFSYYNYKYSQKDSRKWVIEWLRKNGKKTELTKVREANDNEITFTIGALCRMMNDGLPAIPEYVEKVRIAVAKISPKLKVVETDTNEPVVSVHQRMVDNVNDWLGENVEGEIDAMYKANGNSEFKLGDLLREADFPAKNAMLIANAYRQTRDDLQELVSSKTPDEQLTEAYPFRKPKLRKLLAFYDMLVTDAEFHATKKKATRKVRRKKKTPNVQKQVANVKYKSELPDLKLVSETPDRIVGATEAWLFNARYRKLIHVVASNGETLAIRGSTIQNMDDAASVMKIVRKPGDVLADFRSFGKVNLRKLMGSIKSKEQKFTGRLGKDILILKTVK